MTWLTWALITVLFYGLFDFFVKKTSGKVEDGLAAFILNGVSTLVLIIYLIFAKSKGTKFFFSSEGIIYALIGGVMIGLASITFIKMFSTGSNLSIGVAIVRVGMVLMGLLLGMLILKEGLALKQIIGIIIAIFGLALVLLK